MRVVDEALGIVAELTEQHDLRLLRLSVGTEPEGHGEGEAFNQGRAIGKNTKMTTLKFKVGSDIEMGDASAAGLIFSDDCNSTYIRATSR